ncbi:MAG: glycosyltransferase family protein [Chromatiales bacterium]|jgi:spore coat polysaccharide biosynthesis protein SpsF
MKIIATIEARMNSSRLPGKVLMDIGGVRSLECQVARMRRSRYIDEIVLATTVNASDDDLVKFADANQLAVFRGSEDDVMSRILGAARSVNGELQVQTTGDCPLIDAGIIDDVIQVYLDADGKYDFVSNEIVRSYPIGLDCRVFPVDVLAEAEQLCSDPLHRVHGSTYIYMGDGQHRYSSMNVTAPDYLNHPDYRWTLDEPADLQFIKAIMAHFGERFAEFTAVELMNWLEQHPKVIAINADVRQKTIDEG